MRAGLAQRRRPPTSSVGGKGRRRRASWVLKIKVYHRVEGTGDEDQRWIDRSQEGIVRLLQLPSWSMDMAKIFSDSTTVLSVVLRKDRSDWSRNPVPARSLGLILTSPQNSGRSVSTGFPSSPVEIWINFLRHRNPNRDPTRWKHQASCSTDHSRESARG